MNTRMQTRNWMAMAIALGILLITPGCANAAQAQLNVAMGQPTLPADKKQVTYLKVGLTGFSIENGAQRTPVNVALVLDRSGSMQGEKLRGAKDAAIRALDRLGPNDIVSVVVFDHTVNVLVPATKLTDKAAVQAAIERIEAGGSTALFAGVSKGAEEVRKFIDRNRVNRVILLTDGLANVGPSSPGELGALGASLKKEGIAVTTLGLGLDYGEDLLSQLAGKSDGNHAFIKTAADLTRVFNYEFGDVLTVVAQEVSVKIQCADGIRPVRVLGREAEINGQAVYAQLNQLYSQQEKFIMLEVEIPAASEGQSREVATVSVSYANMATRTTDKLSSTVSVSFSKSAEAVQKDENKNVMVDAISTVANDNNKQAMLLRDQGKIEEARAQFMFNGNFLQGNAAKYQSEKLNASCINNFSDAKNVEPGKWESRRKETVQSQYGIDFQSKQ